VSIKKPNMTPSEFRRLKKSEKAMLVAHDVIQQIKVRNFNVGKGDYVGLFGDLDVDDAAPAKENICQIGRACTVCAKGALFLSTIGRVNNARVDEVVYSGDYEICNRLVAERIFTQVQLDKIEEAFEMWNGPDSCYDEAGSTAHHFGKAFQDDDHRLVAIMLNILDHDGKFVPEDKVTQGRVNAALRGPAKTA
jgi:hypothetical protein